MKKLISLFLLVTLLTLSFALFAVSTAAADNTVTLSSGDLAAALNSVADGGTITISGTCAVPSGFTWPTYGKDVTIKGGTLDLTAMGSTVKFNGNVTFEGMTLTMTANATVYANGHKVTVKENVTVTNAVTAIYGGGTSGTTVASTDLTLLAGSYNNIFGGSNGGTVNGDTNVVVGGNVNPSADYTNHSATYNVYGGGNADTIGGDTHMTFTGNAKANYIWGGSKGDAKITGNKYAAMSGGYTMSFYGGNDGTDTGADNYTVMSGGTLQQLFGANDGAGMTGNVDLRVTGGTVERRIYGGCYNEWDYGWKSSYYVTGNIKLVIGGGVSITYSVSDDDRGVFAHSRQKTLSSTENTTLVFADATAYNAYKSKIGQQDILGNFLIMGSTSAADAIHYYTYTATDAVITEACAYHTSYSATATLALDGASHTYTGSAITPAAVNYSAGFEGDPLEITYVSNINVGTGTASITRNGVTATLDFTIAKAEQAVPDVNGVAESIKGKADGKISGLSTEMEYSTDGAAYTKVTDVNMALAAGTYYVRLAETDNCNASPAATVTVSAGRQLTVTFVADGVTVATKYVSWNGTVTDVPAIPEKNGYTQTAPAWNVTDLTNITADLTVTAVYTPNVYTVTFRDGDTVVATREANHGESLSDIPSPPVKEGYNGKWDITNFDTVTGNMTVNAVYTVKKYTILFIVDGKTTMKTVSHGTKLSEISGVPTIPAKTGYDQTPPTWNYPGDTVVTSNLTVTAIYTVNIYTVTFRDGDTVVDTKTVNHGGSLADVPAVPTKIGYDSAWNTTNFDTVTGNMTVLAVYTVKQYTVTFRDGDTVVGTRTVNHGEGITDLPDVPVKVGHTSAWEAVDLTAVTADLTVEAIHTPNTYTVTFKDGDTVVDTKTVTYGEALADIPALPEKEGCNGAWDTTNFDTVTGDMTVNAVYTLKTYTVTFIVDGVAVATVTVNHGEALPGTHIPPEKADHAAEWDAEIPAAITSDMTFTAVYTPITPEPDAGNDSQQPDGGQDDADNDIVNGGTTDGANSNAPSDSTVTEEDDSTVIVVVIVIAAAAAVAGGATAVVILKKKKKKA